MSAADHDDFETEPVRGLPELPPEGERILWQGAPSWRALAWRAFGVRLVLLYFAAIGLWRAAEMLGQGASVTETAVSVALLVPMLAAAAGVLTLMAWITARTTVYTITNRRVAMRIGVALTVTLNLPHRWIGAAALRTHADGTGDIPLSLTGPTRLAYLMIWPHVRPWRLNRAEPALRAVPDAAGVARLLAEALAEANGQEAPADAPVRAVRMPQSSGGGLVAAE